MNSKPDEELLGRWLEDELSGAELEQAEAWVAEHPEWKEWREENRAWKSGLQSVLPAEEEPPAADFFDARLARMIREDRGEPAVAAPARPGRPAPRSTWWVPLAAAAGMAFCFWAGTRISVRTADGQDEPMPVVYTPEQGVEAEVFQSDGADGVVIVLDGVAAIPDSFEVPDRAMLDRERPGGVMVRRKGEEEPVQ
jgi:hypothetical protein